MIKTQKPQSTALHRLSLSSAGVSGLTHLTEKTLGFYLRPLLGKWLKTFKTPSVIVISDRPVPETLWKKRFKARAYQWIPLEKALASEVQPESPWELLVMIAETLEPEVFLGLSARVCKGGAVALVTANQYKAWPEWQKRFEAAECVNVFPVGFHPKGAIAWWPFVHPFWVLPGKVLDAVATFAPGRYPMGLRLGRCWMMAGLKRDDITLLE